jgi:hypothetical protein
MVPVMALTTRIEPAVRRKDVRVALRILGGEAFHVRAKLGRFRLGGVVDNGLDAHGLAVFEILLDPGVLVADVDGHALIGAVDGGLEDLGTRAGDPRPLRRPPLTADLRPKMTSTRSGRPRSRLSATSVSKNALA